jgi:CubicO group peptidase (beta-lactamase class C family)
MRKLIFKSFITVFVFILFVLQVPANDSTKIERVEKGLLPPVRVEGLPTWTLQERMTHYNVPGVSIAVIYNYKVKWAKGYGTVDVTTGEPVTEKTLFQAASISKPVAAAAALHLVEKGKLSLDKNINHFLKSWKLPENEFTKEKKVALKHLLSHSGGITVSGFRGYAEGEEVPSLVQILNGLPPANSEAIRVDLKPETRFRYSGGGFTIMQQALIDIEKKAFPKIMESIVLTPVGMVNSTFQQPLPPEKLKYATAGHNDDGKPIEGKWHTYPEMAAAGLWTTPTDLSRFLIEIQKSLKGKSNKVLSAEMTKKMLTPFASEFQGLGFALDKKGDSVYFFHSGGNQGFRCFMIAHKEKGYGAAVMTNGDAGASLGGEIIRGVARIYKWDDYFPIVYKLAKVDPALLKICEGRYMLHADQVVTIFCEAKRLFIDDVFVGRRELFPISSTTFVRTESPGEFSFVTNEEGSVTGMVLRLRGEEMKLKLLDSDYKAPSEILAEGKFDEAVEAYRKVKKEKPKDKAIGERRLNRIGYQLLGQRKYKEAITVFKVNVEFYLKSANCCDSLAEAYMVSGDIGSAIKFYKKALQILDKYPVENKGREGLRTSIPRNLKWLEKNKTI